MEMELWVSTDSMKKPGIHLGQGQWLIHYTMAAPNFQFNFSQLMRFWYFYHMWAEQCRLRQAFTSVQSYQSLHCSHTNKGHRCRLGQNISPLGSCTYVYKGLLYTYTISPKISRTGSFLYARFLQILGLLKSSYLCPFIFPDKQNLLS